MRGVSEFYRADSDYGDDNTESHDLMHDMWQTYHKEELPALASKFAIPSGTGKPLQEELASSISYLTSPQLKEEVMLEAAGKYPSPENCKTLDVPKVNITIWENFGGRTRSKELKLQRILRLLSGGITVFARSVDGAQLSEAQQDAMALLCDTHFEINCFCKDGIRPEFAHLCRASNVQPAKYLFREDLCKLFKDLQDELKVASDMVKTPFLGKTPLLRRYHPYLTTSGNHFSEAGGNTRSAP